MRTSEFVLRLEGHERFPWYVVAPLPEYEVPQYLSVYHVGQIGFSAMGGKYFYFKDQGSTWDFPPPAPPLKEIETEER